jgi:hypothetical protein
MRWAVPPPERQSTQFIETTREFCRLLSTILRMTNLLASSWPPSIQERSSCGGGPVVYYKMLFAALRFIFCIFEFREVLLPTEGLTPCLSSPSHWVLSFCILDSAWNSNTIGCQFSRYWKWLLLWWLMYLVAPLLFHTIIYSFSFCRGWKTKEAEYILCRK